ncbi:MAG TPA: bile acid:sodium symporter [Pirellulaceae bacterium]|nr:bile acid:sodium symporter [Pirellulaceae bacterium]HMO94025.1 bile acid:sodium symporter [Pirellulaceae bacterium]
MIALIGCLLVGFCCSSILADFARLAWVRYAVTFGVMFLMAWSLETKEVWKSFWRPQAPILASLLNLGLMPLLAWPMTLALSEDWGIGVIAAAATPCTLAAASVWTRRAGGNDITSLMTTVITNAVCFLVTPFWIWAFTARQTSGLSALDMISKLFLLVVLPMLLAQLSRGNRSVATWATNNKFKLSIIAQIGILVMVLVGAVQTMLNLHEAIDHNFWLQLIWLAMLMGALHFTVLFSGIWLSAKLGFPRSDQIAVGISGSQKTLLVGLTTSLEMGISVLPIVVFHTVQLIGDTPVADWFRKRTQTKEQADNR